MKNKLSDLNDHLFAQLELLSDEDLKGDALDVEIRRSSAIVGVAQTAINNAEIILGAHKLVAEYRDVKIPMIENSKEEKQIPLKR
jgi:hypothetical protein